MSRTPSPPEPAPRRRVTCMSARVYSDDEHEVLRAIEAWKKATGCKFPTITDLLGVLLSLGYRKDGVP